jgi:WD40 repeat protein
MSLPAGARLGPYEILDLVGAGGMGEVYRARDPRLGRDVAIKVLSAEVGADPGRLRRFEQEARAVAALNHPNILTVFDVGTHVAVDPRIPYVVMELLQGETLREMISRRAPTQRQILSFAVQVAHGLDAAHAKGIVHRDLKPENVFVTTDGRVKLLDFGLAKQLDRLTTTSGEATESAPTAAGQVVGTVGYMSPEQVRGLPVDARTDVFSFGVLLYELLSGAHPFRRETTIGTLTAILEEKPAELVSLGRGIPPALSGIVRTCLEKSREERFHSTHDLARSLEAVLAAPAGAASLEEVEEWSPYPGLSSFTEKDAAHFFGREAEIRALWQRLQNRRLLAVIGPSGTGKTSFVRAGVIAAAPPGWRCVWVSPGNRPFQAVTRALVPELSSDPETLQRLVGAETNAERVAAIGRWRRQHGEVLLVVDQFEELFTLNPGEVQEDYAALLGRLASEADVHVLVSLRDDFLMRSQEQPPLRPILGELTALLPLSAEALRRAVVEPAKKRGYAFEDEALVEEMVESVEGARGALPLLAFAVSRLWEERDRGKKVLTREAYEAVGGVAGALAQHAEATMDRIGPERQNVVREIFRNLMTAQGTRAVAEREELLSVCPERQAAEEVLRQLIDARLVTSYELEGREGEPSRHRVEVVHESLLKAWPRLVRWQAQDEEGAVLRDQLKQAAHLWEEKGRTSDLLWTGTAFQEFELWRERYAGALTALEEDFARAMAERAQRQRRFRRLVAGSIVAAALVVAGVTGALWRRSEAARERARAEALRAEAGKLLAISRTQLEADPTAALGYVRGSLDLYDTPEARRFAVEVLWRGPVARVLEVGRALKQAQLPEAASYFTTLAISPDGRWLLGAYRTNEVVLFEREGGPPRVIPGETGTASVFGFGPRSDVLVTPGPGHALKYWSLPELREIRAVSLGTGVSSWGMVRGDKVVVFTSLSRDGNQVAQVLDLPDGAPRLVATHPRGESLWAVDANATYAAVCKDRVVGLRALDGTNRVRILGRIRDDPWGIEYSARGDLVAATDQAGETTVWSTAAGASGIVRTFQGPEFAGSTFATVFDPESRRFGQMGPSGTLYLWDLEEFPDARPLVLGRPGFSTVRVLAYDPTGQWLATGDQARTTVEFWPVASPRRRALPGLSPSYYMVFTPDGRWLATCPWTKSARLWPMSAKDGGARDLAEECGWVATDATGQVLVYARGEVQLHPLQGGASRPFLDRFDLALPGTTPAALASFALDPQRRRAVACPFNFSGIAEPEARVLAAWALPSGPRRIHSVAHLTDAKWQGYWQDQGMALAPNGRVYVSGPGGVRRLTLPSEPGGPVSSETIHAAGAAFLDLSRDGRLLLVTASRAKGPLDPHDELLLFDLVAGTSRRITTHGTRLFWGRLSPSGRVVVTGDHDGVVRVGPVTGEEPHLLLGHRGPINGLAISPDERWIASSSDESISIWPLPDVTIPPLHTLPHTELMARLDALTNLRVVRDPASSTGWKLEVGPFPGWKEVPTW